MRDGSDLTRELTLLHSQSSVRKFRVIRKVSVTFGLVGTVHLKTGSRIDTLHKGLHWLDAGTHNTRSMRVTLNTIHLLSSNSTKSKVHSLISSRHSGTWQGSHHSRSEIAFLSTRALDGPPKPEACYSGWIREL